MKPCLDLIGRIVALAVTALPSAASAIVIRHDVPDQKYRVPDGFFPPLADLPTEGHGVLIAPRWVVTVGHVVSGQDRPIREVTIAGRPRSVARVFVHPDFQLPKVPDHGDMAPLAAQLLTVKDIALVELAEPVRDVRPAPLYQAGAEQGQAAEIIGRGATGDGLKGQASDAPHRTVLRRAFNRIVSAEGPWLTYRFDQGAQGLPLEGVLGNGDSGGPVLIADHGVWKLAGLASWKRWDGQVTDVVRAGLYGVRGYQVRLAYYRAWIEKVLAAAGDRLPAD